jgi:hypothetical protein
MLIHFCFGKFLALRICSIFSIGHAEILFESDGSLLLISCRKIMIQMSERMVTRWLKSATENMIQNKETEIRCMCWKCKQTCLLNLFDVHGVCLISLGHRKGASDYNSSKGLLGRGWPHAVLASSRPRGREGGRGKPNFLSASL